MKDYKICNRCVMDTSDTDTVFFEDGTCSHCNNFKLLLKSDLPKETEKTKKLEFIINQIKKTSKNKKYDCLVGVSGGVDSTYVIYKCKQMGLKPLAFHLDNGWNSELAVQNIQNIVSKLDVDLYTEVLDWEEFRQLQLSFFRASVPDLEIPTDFAINAALFKTASKFNIKYIIHGGNTSTECLMPVSWSYGHRDSRYLKHIFKNFGEGRLKYFPGYSMSSRIYYKFVKGISCFKLLNYIPYIKSDATSTIEKELGWRNYEGKHFESVFTRFFQGYILPTKFNFDKRRGHYSALIMTNQMSRPEAIEKLKQPTYQKNIQEEDMAFLIKKFEITDAEFARFMALPNKLYTDYPNYLNMPLYKFLSRVYFSLSGIKSI